MTARTTIIDEIAKLCAREQRLSPFHRNGEQSMQPEQPEADKLAALIESVRALEAAGIRYALIGGLAVGVHAGVPRATLDIDFAVHLARGREKAIQSLEAAGLIKTGEFAHSVNFRHSSGEPVQLAFDPEFDIMIDRAESFEVGGTRVAIVRKEDLIEMKRRAARDPARRKSKRLRDEADVALLLGDVPDPDEGW